MPLALIALIRNDIRLYLTDRRAVIVGILVPILIAAFFGYIFGGSGARGESGRIAIALVDEDHSAVSRAIGADLAAEKLVNLRLVDRAAAAAQVRAGTIDAAAMLPPGFGTQSTRALFTGSNRPVVTLMIDPSKNMSARVVEGLLAQYAMQEISREAFGGATGRQVIDEYLQELDTPAANNDSERAKLRTLLQNVREFNRDREQVGNRAGTDAAGASGSGTRGLALSIPYSVTSTPVTGKAHRPYNGYAHSFAGMAVQFILFAGIDAGVLLLLTRDRGIWQRIRSAPITKSQFLLARTLSTTCIGLFQFSMIYLAATLIFSVRIDGSPTGFVAVATAFCLLNAAFGLMLAAIGRSAPATRGLAIMVTLLLVMLGGAWVPSFVFPAWLQQASRFAPTRWAVDGLDAMTWRGLPLHEALMPVAILLGSALICLGIAIQRFRWEE
jgi:ABC-2 type transport system permease protein